MISRIQTHSKSTVVSVLCLLLIVICISSCSLFSPLERGKGAYQESQYKKAEQLFIKDASPDAQPWLNSARAAQRIIGEFEQGKKENEYNLEVAYQYFLNVVKAKDTIKHKNEHLNQLFQTSQEHFTVALLQLSFNDYGNKNYDKLVARYEQDNGYTGHYPAMLSDIRETVANAKKIIQQANELRQEGDLHFTEKRLNDAIEAWMEAQTINPSLIPEMEYNINSTREIVREIDSFQNLSTKAANMTKNGNWVQSGELVKQALAMSETSDYADYFDHSQIQDTQKKNKIFKEFDNMVRAGQAQMKKANYINAEKELKQAITFAKKNPQCNLNTKRARSLEKTIQANVKKTKQIQNETESKNNISKLKGTPLAPVVIDYSKTYKISAGGEGTLSMEGVEKRWAEAIITTNQYRKLYVDINPGFNVEVYRSYQPDNQSNVIDRTWKNQERLHFISDFFTNGEFFINIQNNESSSGTYEINASLYHMLDK